MILPARQFVSQRLENGLTVSAEINPAAKTMAAGFFVRTGARDETPELSGVSHFLEHMAFKGSERRSASEVNLAFDRMGAEYNAFTGHEYTVFFGAVLPEFAGDLLDLLSDLMRPAIREEDFELERQVIIEEIKLYQDRPMEVLFEKARRKFFGRHPLGHSILGSEDSIRNLRYSDMRSYHSSRYSPDNMILALAGQLDFDQVLSEAARLTADWLPSHPVREYTEFEPQAGETTEAYPQAQQSYLTLLAPGYSYQDSRKYAAMVLANLLGDEGSSRLHWALVDSGLAEAAGAVHDEMDQAGIFEIYAQTDPAHAREVAEVLLGEARRLEREGVHAAEVERATRKVATGLVFASETPLGRLFHLGMDLLYGEEPLPLATIARQIEQINAGQINALLEEKPFSRGFFYQLMPS